MIKALHSEFARIYEHITPRALSLTLARQHALDQEQALYDGNNKVGADSCSLR